VEFQRADGSLVTAAFPVAYWAANGTRGTPRFVANQRYHALSTGLIAPAPIDYSARESPTTEDFWRRYDP
jgi:hypothetical protein